MKYRAKDNFKLKDIAGESILLPRGASTVDFNYVMVFNEAGALLYQAMRDGAEVETLAGLLMEKYAIPHEQALADAQEYLAKMLDAGVIEGA